MNIFKAIKTGNGSAVLPGRDTHCYRGNDGYFYWSHLHGCDTDSVSLDNLERDDWQSLYRQKRLKKTGRKSKNKGK